MGKHAKAALRKAKTDAEQMRMWFELQMWLRKKFLEFCDTNDDNVWLSAEACYEQFERVWDEIHPTPKWIGELGETEAEF